MTTTTGTTFKPQAHDLAWLLIVTYTAPLERIDALLPAHVRYLDRFYASGEFLASGPRSPRHGGVIVAHAPDRDHLDDIVATDPFVRPAPPPTRSSPSPPPADHWRRRCSAPPSTRPDQTARRASAERTIPPRASAQPPATQTNRSTHMSTTQRSTHRTKVGVVGYGVVGKRVADGVALQPDMELVGIADVTPTSLVAVSADRGFPLFAADPSALPGFHAAGLAVSGDLDDLISACDVVVDCSPPGIPEKNLARCRELGTKFICEGGEDHALTGFSFSSFANYAAAAGRDAARVVSCNTTAECRILSTLDRAFSIHDAFLTITRRGADPANIKSGPINATVPVLPGFSHHAPDIVTVIPGLNVKSMAVIASTTLMHVHILRVEVGAICHQGRGRRSCSPPRRESAWSPAEAATHPPHT